MLYRFSGCFPFYPILPTVYSDALSYYEEICQLNSRINDIIKEMDDYGENVLQEANAYTNSQVSQLRISLTNLINSFGTKYEGEIQDLNEKYVELNLSIVKMYDMWTDYNGLMDSKFYLLSQDLKRFITESVSNVTRLYVINPTNGKYQPIQQVLNDMYNALNWGAITVAEYDNINLSAKDYDNQNITAYNYDHYAKLHLFDLIFLRMRSPFTGQLDSYKNIIVTLSNLHKTDSLTAVEYDFLSLTADGYGTKNITAYQYDWQGKTLLGGN